MLGQGVSVDKAGLSVDKKMDHFPHSKLHALIDLNLGQALVGNTPFQNQIYETNPFCRALQEFPL